jgi:hypothetical protein
MRTFRPRALDRLTTPSIGAPMRYSRHPQEVGNCSDFRTPCDLSDAFGVKFVPGIRSPASRGPVKKVAVEGEIREAAGDGHSPRAHIPLSALAGGLPGPRAQHRFPVVAHERPRAGDLEFATFGYAAFPWRNIATLQATPPRPIRGRNPDPRKRLWAENRACKALDLLAGAAERFPNGTDSRDVEERRFRGRGAGPSVATMSGDDPDRGRLD